MSVTIITSENRRLSPAIIYALDDIWKKKPIFDIDDIYDLLYKNKKISVISKQFDQYGKELKCFNGELGKLDIKALFATEDDKVRNELECVMTLSEAAKKWGLSDGSTIRKAIERKRFKQNDIKQAGNVWIITYDAMEKVFGKIKNEENTYIICDDFEFVYRVKDYWEYVNLHYKGEPYIYFKTKDVEIRYQYIRDVLIKGLRALRNSKKVIIKKNLSDNIRQIIETEEEFLSYVEMFESRKVLPKELIVKLLNDLKSISK